MVFSSVYVIDATCFDECFLFHVIAGRRYFFSKFVVTVRFFQPPYCRFLWNKCFERSPYFADFFQKLVFSSVYVINATCFEECFLFHVIAGRRYFFSKFVVTMRFFQTPYCRFLWNKCFERSPYFTLSPQ